MEHSPIGASGYHRWRECPGSVRLSEGLPSISSPEAIQGQRAHECAAIWIKNKLCPKNLFPDLEQEDFDAVETYVDFVNGLLGDRNDKMVLYWVEQKFDLGKVYPGLFGTADFVCYSRRHEKLVVVDYKHGVGMPVEVKENPQLSYYGAGALFELELPVKSVELVIIQPRCAHREGPIRKWQTTPEALEKFLDQLISDAKRTESPDADIRVGEWCRFCPAAPIKCPKIRERSLAVAGESFSAASPYDPEKLSEVLRMLPMMSAWIKSVQTFAANEAQGGRIPPGFKIISKRAQRKWKEGWSGERLAQEFGLKPPELFDHKVKSPAQVEKMISKELRANVEALVDRVASGYKLVEDTDPGQALLDSEIDSFTILEV